MITADSVSAMAAGIVLVGNFLMSVVNWWDNRHIKMMQEEQKQGAAARDVKLNDIQNVGVATNALVDGKSEEIKTLVKDAAFGAGVTAGLTAAKGGVSDR